MSESGERLLSKVKKVVGRNYVLVIRGGHDNLGLCSQPFRLPSSLLVVFWIRKLHHLHSSRRGNNLSWHPTIYLPPKRFNFVINFENCVNFLQLQMLQEKAVCFLLLYGEFWSKCEICKKLEKLRLESGKFSKWEIPIKTLYLYYFPSLRSLVGDRIGLWSR